ncbi:MAG: glycerol-3-phosphate 1-O-acyltransferase PlsY [Clostridia bacterium]|nr:glycerol-3-phosphate 1-O-acyltransferase PlsY [Clostridia bacterium]
MDKILLITIAVGVLSYLVGSINCSILISRLMKKDVRESGSGNAGATNMARTFGTGVGVLTMLCDFFKALLPLVLTRVIFQGFYQLEYWQALVAFSGFCCSLGHAFPIFFGFRGGKSVTVVGMTFLVVDWRCFVVGISVFIVIVALTRYVSLGSMLAGISGPITMYFVCRSTTGEYYTVACLAGLALMIIWLHRENVKRLLSGTEHKFKSKK